MLETAERQNTHDSNIPLKSRRKIQQDATMYQNFIIPYLYKAQNFSGRNTAHHQEPKTALAASGFL